MATTVEGMVKQFSKFAGLSDFQAFMNKSDQFNNIQTNLQIINDNSQDPLANELSDKIFASADRSRSSYIDSVSYINALESDPSSSFSSNDESLVFVELLQKSFQAGGSNTAEQQSGMSKLVESMVNGTMQDSDLTLMMNDAPMLAAALSSYTGTSIVELEKLAQAGAISANIFKNAVFSATDPINAELSDTNATFESTYAGLQNALLQSFGPLFVMLNEKLNETGMFDKFLQVATFAFTFAADAAAYFLDIVFSIFDFFAANWTFIEPLIWGVVGAISALFVINSIISLVDLFSKAWTILNAAMKANVFITIISVVIGLITLFWNLMATNDTVYTTVMRAWNGLLNFFDQVRIFFAKVFFGVINTFMDFRVAFLETIDGLINGAISKINWLIGQFNKIPGVSIDLIGTVDFSKGERDKADAMRKTGESIINEMENEAAAKMREREKGMQDVLTARAAERAAKEESKVTPTIDPNKFTGFSNDPDPITPGSTTPSSMSSNSINNIDKVNQVGKINDTVDISSEDIKMMRELAELNNIQNFVSLTPSVSFGDTHVRNDGDINTIIARITETLENDIVSSADAAFG